MPSLSDKLKALGVKVGTVDLPKPVKRSSHSIEQIIPGHSWQTPQGETFVVETRYPIGHPHGRMGLKITASLDILATWAKESHIRDLCPQSFAFLDTETTGLSSGTGTYTFLIGAGRFVDEEFHLAQFFMRDPIEEPAQLAAFEQFLAPCEAIVTFNGKSFDVPILNSRYIMHSWQTPLADTAHIDLLHLARRLWRDRLPKRALIDLEAQILGTFRTEEDVPGWMVPKLYSDYLLDGDPHPLKSVFYHNAMDILSLVTLFNHMAGLLTDPFNKGSDYGIDLIALAKLFEDLGDLDKATRLYIHSLEHEDTKTDRLPRSALLEAIQRLALIYKRQEDFHAAITLWEQAARHQHLHAHVELAKFYEHHIKDYEEAIHWTKTAIDLVEDSSLALDITPSLVPHARRQWSSDLRHRLTRLERKQSTNSTITGDSLPASDT